MWNIYRNSEFLNSVGPAPPISQDWIFSRKSFGSPLETTQSTQTKPASVSLPLYGSVHATAYWFADVYIGSPQSQLQSLIVDTGSSVMGFPCSDCSSQCGHHIDAPYNTSASCSINPIGCHFSCPLCAASAPRAILPSRQNHVASSDHQCAYHIHYTEGSSLSGRWYEDQVFLSENPFDTHFTLSSPPTTSPHISISVPFGCHSEETHLFVSQDASGILGLEATSRFGPPPFVTSVLADLLGLKKVNGRPPRDLGLTGTLPTGSQTEPVFAMCISQQGGILTIGAPNSKYHIEEKLDSLQVPMDAQDFTPTDNSIQIKNQDSRPSRVPRFYAPQSFDHPRHRSPQSIRMYPPNGGPSRFQPSSVVSSGTQTLSSSTPQSTSSSTPASPVLSSPTRDNSRSPLQTTPSGTNTNKGNDIWIQTSFGTGSSNLDRDSAHQPAVTSLQDLELQHQYNPSFNPSVSYSPMHLSATQTPIVGLSRDYLKLPHYRGEYDNNNRQNYGSSYSSLQSGTLSALPSSWSLQPQRGNIGPASTGTTQLLENSWISRTRWSSRRLKDTTHSQINSEAMVKNDSEFSSLDPRKMRSSSEDGSQFASEDLELAGQSNDDYAHSTNLSSLPQDSIEKGAMRRMLPVGQQQRTSTAFIASNPLPQTHYHPTRDSNRWTPLMLDSEEDGGWPGSYVAILQGWKLKGAAQGETILGVSRYAQSQQTRTSQVYGLPALVDSGTTLTYVPFLLYANLWTAILRNVEAATKTMRKLKQGPNQSDTVDSRVVRVAGIPISQMRRRLQYYIDRSKDQYEEEKRQDRRKMEEKSFTKETNLKKQVNGIGNVTNTGPKSVGVSSTIESATHNDTELELAEKLKRELQELESSYHRGWDDIDIEATSEFDRTVNDERSAQKRSVSDTRSSGCPSCRGSVAFSENQQQYNSSPQKSSSPLRRLIPVRHFPDMLLQFANNVEHIWRPTSYLYRKGKTKVYCLTIVAEETNGDEEPSFSNGHSYDSNTLHHSGFEQQLGSTARDQHSRILSFSATNSSRTVDKNVHIQSTRRRLQEEIKQAVLGSSFFIDYDVVFHLGRWELAFFPTSGCPKTNLDSRTQALT